jgi:hypothetical protein
VSTLFFRQKKGLTKYSQAFDLSGAGDGTRTRDRLITNQLLYQLSYASEELRIIQNIFILTSIF